MSSILWLDLQPSVFCFNKKLACILSQSRHVRRWSFQHDLDEICSLETIFDFLRETVDQLDSKPHVVGHGLSGTVASLFARQFPTLFRSLTLLSVDPISTNQWTSHYLEMRRKLPCSRSSILSHIVPLLFDKKFDDSNLILSSLCEKCLDSDYIPGSIASHSLLPNLCSIDIPLSVINGSHDFVVDQNSGLRWKPYLKNGDRFYSFPQGHHFSHFSQPKQYGELINSFLDMIPDSFSSAFPDQFHYSLSNKLSR
jgi:pimeloyl-ACP methyl ester carboxylesterase